MPLLVLLPSFPSASESTKPAGISTNPDRPIDYQTTHTLPAPCKHVPVTQHENYLVSQKCAAPVGAIFKMAFGVCKFPSNC